MIIFPSYLLHKVHPVVTGTRVSLVMWFHGAEMDFWKHGEHAYQVSFQWNPDFLDFLLMNVDFITYSPTSNWTRISCRRSSR